MLDALVRASENPAPLVAFSIASLCDSAISAKNITTGIEMSSGFVSGGTADAPIERSDEWLAAQKEIEANRRRKEEESRQSDGRSLYDTLQANKGVL